MLGPGKKGDMELRSGKNEMLSIDFDARGISISSLHGALGLAQDRGLNDHLAHVGQNSDCIGNGKFFIVALGSASQEYNFAIFEQGQLGGALKNTLTVW